VARHITMSTWMSSPRASTLPFISATDQGPQIKDAQLRVGISIPVFPRYLPFNFPKEKDSIWRHHDVRLKSRATANGHYSVGVRRRASIISTGPPSFAHACRRGEAEPLTVPHGSEPCRPLRHRTPAHRWRRGHILCSARHRCRLSRIRVVFRHSGCPWPQPPEWHATHGLGERAAGDGVGMWTTSAACEGAEATSNGMHAWRTSTADNRSTAERPGRESTGRRGREAAGDGAPAQMASAAQRS
jgi:hypothetical protein